MANDGSKDAQLGVVAGTIEPAKPAKEEDTSYLDDLSDQEALALPGGVIFFLRDLAGYLEWESDLTANKYAKDIQRFVERHHDLLVFERESK